MSEIITITPQWQIYLPVEIRRKIGLVNPGQAKITVDEGKISIKPQKSQLLRMAGKYQDLSKKKRINLEKIREQIDYSFL